ncbi:hypothetical protein PHLGIDRAFT_332081 [Phlebiopsis gigantea 11061_1 CR5-6]|uniref:Uncharacterized protein n=1 Tax=Phlebiopsis gigantea (strain 11061_1 CR5-6) TaxID=745531 RepID=A0A0C3PWK5_PHLG1|nr:hypothetical protein PHLGIDRAFT_332081 [Phlebiopsis gigantea 11061_1 CR5-6]
MPYETQRYRNPRHRRPYHISSLSNNASLGELTCLQEVASLRKLSKNYLVPKSFFKQLAQRSERVRKFIRRRTGASVSPHTLVENLDRVSIKADTDHTVGAFTQAQPAASPNSNVTEVDTELRDRLSSFTLHAPRHKNMSLSVSKTAASLSQRRLASNRPTLARLLPLPPAPMFEGWTPPSRNLLSSSSSPKEVYTPPNDTQPITPVDQVLHECSSPPDAPRQIPRKKKRPSLLTSLLSQSLTDLGEDVSSPYPFTPIEEQLASTMESYTPIARSGNDDDTLGNLEPSSAAADSAPRPVIAHPSPRKILVNIPRRLSYSHGTTTTPSPISLEPPPLADLASPLLLHAPHFGSAFSHLGPLSSPATPDSPNYFSN